MRKMVKFYVCIVIFLAIGGCAKDNAVAMNLYEPKSGEVEVSSGVSIEITQDMIDRANASINH